MRIIAAVLLTLALGLTLSAADPAPPAGSWKLTLPIDRGEEVVFLLAFAQKDGKWAGEFVDCTAELKVRPKAGESIVLPVVGELLQHHR